MWVRTYRRYRFSTEKAARRRVRRIVVRVGTWINAGCMALAMGMFKMIAPLRQAMNDNFCGLSVLTRATCKRPIKCAIDKMDFSEVLC